MLVVLICQLVLAGQSMSEGAPPPAAAPKPAAGATPKSAAGTNDAQQAVRQAIKAYVDAINAGDFKAVARFWTADGDYADPTGRVFTARKVIEEELAKRFAGPGHPKLSVDVAAVRLISPDVAIEDGQAEVTPAGGGPPTRGHYTATWVRQQGKWLISSLRESRSARHDERQRLSQLEWLVGHWKGEAGGATVEIDAQWSPSHAYLIREIEVQRDGQSLHAASQRIAFDPETRRLKAWTFDADGGHAESFWSETGGDWVAQSTGVTRDGRTATGRSIFRDIGPESFTLETTDTHVGGQSRPDIKIHFSRETTGE